MVPALLEGFCGDGGVVGDVADDVLVAVYLEFYLLDPPRCEYTEWESIKIFKINSFEICFYLR